MSLYGRFQAELYGRKIIENEFGFILYSKFDDNSVYAHSLYVLPERRHEGKGRELEEALIEREKPSVIFSYIDLTTNNPTLSVKAHLAVGYEIFSANESAITMRKELSYE
jgi:GNAT superfamily N-acetyltransferase